MIISKISLLLMLVMLSAAVTMAQTATIPDTAIAKVWTKGASLGLNIAQVGLTNWVAGGQNSVALSGLESFFINMNKGKIKWSNQLDVGFGLIRQGKDATFYKSDDKLILLSKVGRQLNKHWYETALIDFRTQMAPGNKYRLDSTEGKLKKDGLLSQFMSPGYLITSIGGEFRTENFYFMVSPLTGKFTFVLNDTLSKQGAFGVDPGEKVRKELGAYVNIGFNKKLMENITLNTKVTLFSNYQHFGNIDVNWEGTLIMKVNKYISTSISTQLIYDDDIKLVRSKDGSVGPGIQFKEVLNVGLLYRINR